MYDIIHDIFYDTLNSEPSIRNEAERRLYELSNNAPQLVVSLAEFAVSDMVPMQRPRSREGHMTSFEEELYVRQASAIRFKNVISRCDWNRKGSTNAQYFTKEVREEIKAKLVSWICTSNAHEHITSQFIVAFESVFYYEWPKSKWGSLLGEVKSLLTGAAKELSVMGASYAPSRQQRSVMFLMLQRLGNLVVLLRIIAKYYEKETRQIPWEARQGFADALCEEVIPVLQLVTDQCAAVKSCQGALVEALQSRAADLLQQQGVGDRELTGEVLRYLSAASNINQRMAELLRAAAAPDSDEGDADTLIGDLFLVVSAADKVQHFAQKCIYSALSNTTPHPICDVKVASVLFDALGTSLVEARHRMECYKRLVCARSNNNWNEAVIIAGGIDALGPQDFWKKLKWSAKLTKRLVQQWGDYEFVEDRAVPTARCFMERYSAHFLESTMGILEYHHHASDIRLLLTSKLAVFCIEYLEASLGVEPLYRKLHEHAEYLLTDLMFHRLGFTVQDEELWESNPEDYIRALVNPREDSYSMRVASMSFTYHMCSAFKPEFHDQTLLGVFVNFIVGVLGRTREDNSNSQHARVKDGCFLAIIHLQALLRRLSGDDDSQIESVLLKYVVPELTSPHGFLRAKAVWVLSQFTKIQWSSIDSFHGILNRVLVLLEDGELPVRLQTCVHLSKFIRRDAAKEVVAPHIAHIIQQYFRVMSQMDNESVILTLRKVMRTYSDTVSQWAVELSHLIVSHFHTMRERLSRMMRETEYDDIEEAAEGEVGDTLDAADQVIRSLVTIVRAVTRTVAKAAAAADTSTASASPAAQSTQRHIMAQIMHSLQEEISPLIYCILANSRDHMGFLEVVLRLLTELLIGCNSVIASAPSFGSGDGSTRAPMDSPIFERTWRILPLLYRDVLSGSLTDYFEQLLAPLDNYISVDCGTFLMMSCTPEDDQVATDSNGDGSKAGRMYPELLGEMCECILSNYDLHSREVCCVAVLVENLMLYAAQCNHAFIEQYVGKPGYVSELVCSFVSVLMSALYQRPPKVMNASLRMLLCNSVCACIVCRPLDALARLHEGESLLAFFDLYSELFSRKGASKTIRRYDKRLFVVMSAAILNGLGRTAPNNSNEVTSRLPSDMLGKLVGTIMNISQEYMGRNIKEDDRHAQFMQQEAAQKEKRKKLAAQGMRELRPGLHSLRDDVSDDGDSNDDDFNDDDTSTENEIDLLYGNAATGTGGEDDWDNDPDIFGGVDDDEDDEGYGDYSNDDGDDEGDIRNNAEFMQTIDKARRLATKQGYSGANNNAENDQDDEGEETAPDSDSEDLFEAEGEFESPIDDVDEAEFLRNALARLHSSGHWAWQQLLLPFGGDTLSNLEQELRAASEAFSRAREGDKAFDAA